jgi:hypothetical protein
MFISKVTVLETPSVPSEIKPFIKISKNVLL